MYVCMHTLLHLFVNVWIYPVRPSALSPEQFDNLSLRCGRVLTETLDVSIRTCVLNMFHYVLVHTF